jgi:hypothetical protein
MGTPGCSRFVVVRSVRVGGCGWDRVNWRITITTA